MNWLSLASFTRYRILKFLSVTAYFLLIWLSVRTLNGTPLFGDALGLVALSAGWLALTRLQLKGLLFAYWSTLARFRVMFPVLLGWYLTIMTFNATSDQRLLSLALVEGLAWYLVAIAYCNNRRNFKNFGHGALPDDIWINPPPEVAIPGDTFVTSGQLSEELGPLGHVEGVFQKPFDGIHPEGEEPATAPDDLVLEFEKELEGSLAVLSSWMPRGAVITPIPKFIAKWLRLGENYIILRLKVPLTPKQIRRLYEVAIELVKRNTRWKNAINKHRKEFIENLPLLSSSIKSGLIKVTYCTGYDWWGLITGRIAHERWTCICIWVTALNIVLEEAKREDPNGPVQTLQPLGTGILGMGTGILDPIMPFRLLAQKALRYLNLQDKAEWEERQKLASATAPT